MPNNKRNVVIVGKTGAGKSTVANKILELSPEVSKAGSFHTSNDVLASVTINNDIRKISFECNGEQYDVNLIDTVGLFDTGSKHTASSDSAKRNNKLMDDLKEFFEEHIPDGLSLVLFVCTYQRWTDEEQDTFDCIVKSLEHELSPISALIITRCDNFDEEKLANIPKEYKEVECTKHVCEFMKKGLFPVGFPDLAKVREEFRSAYAKDAEEYKKQLQKLICEAKEKKLTTKHEREEANSKAKKSLCNIL